MKRMVLGAWLVVLCYGSPLLAQPAPTPEEVQQAQARWAEGKASFDAGNYEAARVAFKQAFILFQHPFFLQNLGEAELRCGRTVEAARHLSQFIRTATSATPAQREAAKRSLKKASEKLGSVIVETNSDEAEVRVDDEVIGRSPLGSMQWFVEPGAHVVSARKEGYLDGSEKVDIPTGPSKSVFVKLQRVTGGAPSEAPQPKSVAAESDKPPPVPTAPDSTAGSASVSTTTIAPRTVVLIGEAALTVTAISLSLIYNSKAANDISQRNSVRDQFVPLGGLFKDTCVNPTAKAGPPCLALASSESQITKDMNYRLAFGVAGGVLAAATVATYFLWPATPAQRPIALSFDVGRGHGAVWLDGRF
jgi:hypothetical protein